MDGLLKGIGGVVLVLIVLGYLHNSRGGNASGSHDVTRAQFNVVAIGDTKQDVRDWLGAPRSSDEQIQAGSRSECWYYDGANHADYQFCFDNGSLRSKNRY